MSSGPVPTCHYLGILVQVLYFSVPQFSHLQNKRWLRAFPTFAFCDAVNLWKGNVWDGPDLSTGGQTTFD